MELDWFDDIVQHIVDKEYNDFHLFVHRHRWTGKDWIPGYLGGLIVDNGLRDACCELMLDYSEFLERKVHGEFE